MLLPLHGLRRFAAPAAPAAARALSTIAPGSVTDVGEVLRTIVAGSVKPLLRIDEPFPGVPELTPSDAMTAPETRLTTLDNGLRVMSIDMFAQTACVGVFVNTGSRMETAENRGVSHFLELMALKTTETRSSKELIESLEWMGAVPMCSSARDHIMYMVDVPRENTSKSMEVLADAVLRPALTAEDIEEEKTRLPFMREAFEMDPHTVMVERMFEAGFGGTSPVGQPSFCPDHSVGGMTAGKIRKYMEEWFVGPEMVLVGINVDHEDFVGMANDHFACVPGGSGGGGGGGGGGDGAGAAAAAGATRQGAGLVKPTYTGGELQVYSPDPHNIMEGFSHVGVAFQINGWDNIDDVYAACVLHSLFGGGDAFSAGGPGKGMYSRLFQQVLNRYGEQYTVR
jgi:processing peptidase subunit alpha